MREYLLTPEQAAAMDAPGHKDAAVLVPLYRDPLTAVFTERRADLRRHAGEISFPGGRQDHPDEDLRSTALREAEEEIGLDPAGVELVGALPPVGTFVTGYRIFPFVGLIEPGQAWRPQATEVEQVLEFTPRRPRPRPRDAAADPQGRSDQDAHLHGGRPPRLGSDRTDRAVAARAAWRRCSRRPSRSGRRPCCPTRSTSRRSSSRRPGRAARAARTRCAPSARRCGSRR